MDASVLSWKRCWGPSCTFTGRVHGGEGLQLRDVLGGEDIKQDAFDLVLVPVVVQAVCCMRHSEASVTPGEGISLELAHQKAKECVSTPNGGYGKTNGLEEAYSKTFWRGLFGFGTSPQRSCGKIIAMKPSEITIDVAVQALYPYVHKALAEQSDGENRVHATSEDWYSS